MASLQEQMAKLNPSQRKEVERIRSRGIGFDPDVGGIEGLAKSGGGVSRSGSFIPKGSRNTVTSVQSQPDFMDQFRALQEAQTKATIAELEKAKGAQLSALSGERETVQPRFQEARRGAITEAERGRAGFDQFLAQRRLEGSGAGAQSELAQNVAQQQALGGLRQQEAETFADIARREAGVKEAFASDVAAAEAGGHAQLLQNLINQQNIERQFGLQEAGLTGKLGGVQTLAGRAAEQSALLFEDQRAQIQQALEAGEISNEQARFALEQSQDPNSVTNQSAKIALEIAQIQLENLPEQQRLAIETAKKQLAQIGRRPILSESQKLAEELKVLQIRDAITKFTTGAADLSQNIGTVQSGIDTALGRIPRTDEAGFDIPVSEGLLRSETATQIVNAFANGQIDEAGVQQLMTANGLNEADIQRAVNALGLTSGAISLPGF